MLCTFRFTVISRENVFNSIPKLEIHASFHQEKNLTDPCSSTTMEYWQRAKKSLDFYSRYISQKEKNKIPRKPVLFNDG